MATTGPEGARDWCPVDAGAITVGVAERDALGTTARVVAWPPGGMGRVLAAVDAELALLDEQASRSVTTRRSPWSSAASPGPPGPEAPALGTSCGGTPRSGTPRSGAVAS